MYNLDKLTFKLSWLFTKKKKAIYAKAQLVKRIPFKLKKFW